MCASCVRAATRIRSKSSRDLSSMRLRGRWGEMEIRVLSNTSTSASGVGGARHLLMRVRQQAASVLHVSVTSAWWVARWVFHELDGGRTGWQETRSPKSLMSIQLRTRNASAMLQSTLWPRECEGDSRDCKSWNVGRRSAVVCSIICCIDLPGWSVRVSYCQVLSLAWPEMVCREQAEPNCECLCY